METEFMTTRNLFSRQKRSDVPLDLTRSLSDTIFYNFFNDPLQTAYSSVLNDARMPGLFRDGGEREARALTDIDISFRGRDKVIDFSCFIKLGTSNIVVGAKSGYEMEKEELPFRSTESEITEASKSVIRKIASEVFEGKSSKHSRRHRKGHLRRNHRRRGRFRESRRQKTQSGSTLFDMVEEYNMKIARLVREEFMKVKSDDVELEEVRPSNTASGFIGNVSLPISFPGDKYPTGLTIGVEAGNRVGDGASLIASLGGLPTHFLGSIIDPGSEVVDPAVTYIKQKKQHVT